MASGTKRHEFEGDAASLLRSAIARLDGGGGELALDFSEVRRIDAAGLRGIEDLAAKARNLSVKVVLRGVNPEVYKVLKLVGAAAGFSFVN